MVLGGDLIALRRCLQRLVPDRKEARIQSDLPALQKTNAAQAAALEALVDRRITAAGAECAVRSIESSARMQSRIESRQEAEAWFEDVLNAGRCGTGRPQSIK